MPKFDSAENMKYWQRGLVKYEQLSEDPKSKGAQMELFYDMGKRKMKLLETIVSYDLPDSMVTEYTTDGMYNLQKNSFSETADGHTLWTQESEFSSDKLMMKLMLTLMPGMFKKQSMKYMLDFKKWLEEGVFVLD